MGISIYPVLNKQIPSFDATEMSGKALAAAVFVPGSAFAALERFSSMNEEELRELIAGETGQDPNEIEVPEEEWFVPEDGLTVVRELFTQPAPLVEGGADDFAEETFLGFHFGPPLTLFMRSIMSICLLIGG